MSDSVRAALEILNEPRKKAQPKPDCETCNGLGEHECHWAGHGGHTNGHMTRCGCIPFIGDGARIDELEDKVERARAALTETEALPCPPCMECGGPTKLYGVFDLTEWNCKDAKCGTFTIKSVPARRG